MHAMASQFFARHTIHLSVSTKSRRRSNFISKPALRNRRNTGTQARPAKIIIAVPSRVDYNRLGMGTMHFNHTPHGKPGRISKT